MSTKKRKKKFKPSLSLLRRQINVFIKLKGLNGSPRHHGPYGNLKVLNERFELRHVFIGNYQRRSDSGHWFNIADTFSKEFHHVNSDVIWTEEDPCK